MHFLKDGPDIPDDLLIARDQGRVIFFCGAGVSRAKTGLPDFFELARSVIDDLGALENSPARQLFKVAKEVQPITGVGALISADRIFGLLNREFNTSDLQVAVAKALRPTSVPDLAAHKIILDLAKGADGRSRVITTNFDLLFEACDSGLPRWAPPRLPNPDSYDDLAGIIHLHGRVDDGYEAAADGGFVLSSAEFGRAYLSDAWATQFIRSILQKYCVVFVGYTADDPPMQYLLEALNGVPLSGHGIYAFHAGTDTDGQAIWRHKGVQPIAYSHSSDHSALWNTLAEWAVRARDPDKWIESRIELARKGPESLTPHERGQVVHIVSTKEGARRFASPGTPPPGDWLCVFDPAVRYERPGQLGKFGEQGPYFDPFTAYGLDSDLEPKPIQINDPYAKRDIPKGALDCLQPNRLDRENLQDGNFAVLRGHSAGNVPAPAPRLLHLGAWIASVASQPATTWWIAGQASIHPAIRSHIRFWLNHADTVCQPEVREAWRFIFEAWDTQADGSKQSDFDLKATIKSGGWHEPIIRELARLQRPFFKVSRPYWGGPRPPKGSEIAVRDLVNLDVEYPRFSADIEIPDEHLLSVIRSCKDNLTLSVALEEELGGYGLQNIPPLNPDPNVEGKNVELGLARLVRSFLTLLDRLIKYDVRAVRQEFVSWPNNIVFARFRIWVAGQDGVLTPDESGDTLRRLSDDAFWGMRSQRDLLLAMAKLWPSISVETKRRLETRIIRGPMRWRSHNKDDHRIRRAVHSLERMIWLQGAGCDFSDCAKTALAELKAQVPDWKDSSAVDAAASTEARGGFVRQDATYAPLLSVPLKDVLSTAAELAGREHFNLVERVPFSGLAAAKPAAALGALNLAAQNLEYPEWAWHSFLYAEARKTDKLRLRALIAERLARLPKEVLAKLAHPVTSWFEQSSAELSQSYPLTKERLWERLVQSMKVDKAAGASALLRNGAETDWGGEALNSPPGRLAQSLLDDVAFKNATADTGFMPEWLAKVEDLLDLGGDAGRHALVMLTFPLARFYWIAPEWTERHLLSALDRTGDDQDAFWSGFFWNGNAPGAGLYPRLKQRLLMLAAGATPGKRGHATELAAILLRGWGNLSDKGEPFISDDEMRGAIIVAYDELRSSLLWQLGRWAEQELAWRPKRLQFLTEVWPRQKVAKTPRVSSALCELACDSGDDFPALVEAVLPLLTPAEDVHLSLYSLGHVGAEPGSGLAAKYPRSALGLLWAALPESVATWPYNIGELLTVIPASDQSLIHDERLIELGRRWNSR